MGGSAVLTANLPAFAPDAASEMPPPEFEEIPGLAAYGL
jgi:hypothetical protein